MSLACISAVVTWAVLAMADVASTPGSPQAGSPGTAAAEFMPRLVGAGVLGARDSASYKVPIDVQEDCMFWLASSAGDFEIQAVSPTGKIWSSNRKDQGGRTDELSEFIGGPVELLELKAPEPGEWTIRVTVDSLPDTLNRAAYRITLVQDTGSGGPQLRVQLSDSDRYRGDSLVVRASLLEDGKPVRGAQVRADVGSYDGPVHSISLRDDGNAPDDKAGDGFYAGRVSRLDGKGFAAAEISATRRGVPGLVDFERAARVSFLISESRSRFTGAFREVAKDEDGDGINEAIVFKIGVHVTDTTDLKVNATVRDSAGREVWSYGPSAHLEPGDHELEVECQTEYLAKLNASGPLALDSLALFEDNTYALLDTRTNAYRTRPFARRELMQTAVQLEGIGSARGVDFDRDGKFDALEAEVPIYAIYPGQLFCFAVLDNGKRRVLQVNLHQDIVAGRNVLKFRFPGACIASKDEESEYTISDIALGYSRETPGPKPPRQYGYNDLGSVRVQGPPPSRFESTPSRSVPAIAYYSCE